MDSFKYVIGVDEAGRGSIAGPLSVGAVCIREDWLGFRGFAEGVRDSKKLTEKGREEWFEKLEYAKKAGLVAFSCSFISPHVIDAKGLTWSTKTAVRRAVTRFRIFPEHCSILLDGNLTAPKIFQRQVTIIGGDETESVISLASIVAKVSRDRLMRRFKKKFPNYGFEKHKGYGTPAHYEAIDRFGVTEIHRVTFL